MLEEDVYRLDSMLRGGLHPDADLGFDVSLLVFFMIRKNVLAVSMLLQWGADPNRLIESPRGVLSPLHVAADQALEDVVWILLLDGCAANRVEERRTPLFLAANLESPTIAKMLIDAGAEVDLGLDRETPLMAAAEAGRSATVDLLIAHGADVNASSSSGWSPLHHAAWSDHPEIAKTLIDHGADPLHVDEAGRNATDHARVMFDPVYAQIYRNLGIPDAYSPEDAEDDWEPQREFDYFISYRHGRFAGLAEQLARRMSELGLRPFIDQKDLGISLGAASSRAVLKSRLAKAVQRSRCLVFFETYLDPPGEEARGDRPSGFEWQFFELLNARAALLVSIDSGWCKRCITETGKRVKASDVIFIFSYVNDLATKLCQREWDEH
jgi:hypothetical protein